MSLCIVFTARRDDFHIAPSVRVSRCEKIGFRAARQTKPSAPPSLLSKGLQTGWGRRFRLPGQFFTPSDAWGYVAATEIPCGLQPALQEAQMKRRNFLTGAAGLSAAVTVPD